ncbi:MAG TPA: DUF5916 domain-containing protein, partial [Bacteroidia bacterium]|nr:DUF5916 domain-containing protein [Bacteroidia bacterium]
MLSAFFEGFTQDTLRSYSTVRINSNIKIDGHLDEDAWKQAPAMNDFFQFLPNEGTQADHPIDVRVVYDNNAIYIGAMMFDSSPDSILKELGARDMEDLNSDYLRICFDPYNNRQDAYFFGVYASGVQFDSKVSDLTYDAVWESEVKITDKGWVAEMKIPYSAIRFPKMAEQLWAFQVNRYVRRSRELSQWAKTPSKTNNSRIYWGTIKGISNVTAPLRLSLTPYLSSYLESSPVVNDEGKISYSNSFSYNVGADIKYGIDERFTLDMTLLPDFGQVQSDDKVKNLSYREVTYDENRSFFKEGVDLFDKNKLFYSRRIGKIPSGFFSLESELKEGESIEENPSQTKLLNAIKLSGRSDHGMGIGVFNAITDNCYATIKDSLGETRKVLTEPLTNYNVIVFDQQMKNNSSIYFINTNVTRDKGYDDANVTGSGFTLSNKKNTFAFEGEGAISQQFAKATEAPDGEFTTTLGYNYGLSLKKLGGTFEYGAARSVYDNNYYTSDLGYQIINNKIVYEAYVNHNLHQPWKFLRNSYNNIYYTYATHFQTGKPVLNEFNLNLFGTFLDYNSIFGGGGFTPGTTYDYFEPRVEGRYNRSVKYYYSYLGFSSDYRKKVAVDINLNMSNFIGQFVSEGFNINIGPRYRVSDKFTVKLSSYYGFDPYNLGFADIEDDGDIIYGLRILNTFINELNAVYLFKNDMFVSVNVRHYWATAKYRKYVTLLENGEFEDNYDYAINNDFNYNAFNIDFVYSWQFAPGSNLSIVYKNAIENDEYAITQIP